MQSGGFFLFALLLVFIAGLKMPFGNTPGVLAWYIPNPQDTTKDTNDLPYGDNGLFLNNPNNFTEVVEYDPETGEYVIKRKVGNLMMGLPQFMTAEEYQDYVYNKELQEYWKNKAQTEQAPSADGPGGIIPKMQVGGENFDRIFGSNVVQIRPNGSATLTFSGVINRNNNPALSERNQRTANFQFDEEIRMNVVGQIGEKLKLQTNYDTKAQFDFQNQMKLEYTGFEDEIIKKIELGNVSLPLTGTLITGAQSLFGIKTQLQFGRATITSVYSEQKSESKVIEVEGGAKTNDFEIQADQYEANRHYFLGQYFRDAYDQALSNLPVINSAVNITRVEVWVTNRNNVTENTRNIVGFMDLGEGQGNVYNTNEVNNVGNGVPDNTINSLNPPQFTTQYPGIRDLNTLNSALAGTSFDQSIDYEKIENARMLTSSEYTVNERLGFISLNQSLNNDEVLGVAFQYTANGKTYQVGEFSTDGIEAPDVLMVKLLKSTITNVKLPMWDLMMKNVYSIGAFQVNRDEFRLDVLYANDNTGAPINYLPEGPPNVKNVVLLKLLNLDNLNTNNDPQPDGVFDFLASPVITINAQNGRVYFPVVEPFGSHLREQFGSDQDNADKYVYDALYDSTRAAAQQIADKNKFFLSGTYKSASGSEIRLNAINIPPGSVTVTAGGQKLIENTHYTVDYTLGTVRIIDEGLLNSGQKISVQLESNTLFNLQTRRFMGTHIDYKINRDFVVGASILNLSERPLTQKINIGDEPINNTIWGLNGNYSTESRFLTSLVDYIPLIETKEKSNVTLSGEFAQIIPGHPDAIEVDNESTSYIDDFEGAESSITLKAVQSWVIASTPAGQPNLFPESATLNDLAYGFNRARLAWYTIDQLFWQNTSITPDHIADDEAQQASHPVREVLQTELFPERAIQPGFTPRLPTLDLAYYPSERGPYNFDVEGEPGISSGIDQDGNLKDPETRWAGVMRRIQTNDFEAANVEFIEFWMLDPFIDDPNHDGGDLYFNLGNVSEDILKDSRKSFENGLPTSPDGTLVDTTIWGRVPSVQSLVNAFDNDPATRVFQDVGLDGLSDAGERNFAPYKQIDPTNDETYLDRIANLYNTNSGAYQKANQDPAADNFHYYRGDDYDAAELSILERYKLYNGLEGNSPTADQSPDGIPNAQNSPLPNVEDINQDQTLSETEAYYQYKVSLRPEDFEVGSNYIIDKIVTPVQDNPKDAVWYQFRIPIRQPDQVIGNISDFRSIRFIRMFLKDFDQEVVCRFATLDLIRGDWRKYNFSLKENQEVIIEEPNDQTEFNISTVNLEENSKRTPINYVLPPGIEREVLFGATSLQSQNEQSMVLEVCNLEDGDARAAFKNVNMDMRTYKRIKMFVHAESVVNGELQNGDVAIFMRIGSDFSNNYYQYEKPLNVTPWGATDEASIWPESNEVDFAMTDLQTAKQLRNQALRDNPNLTASDPFTATINGAKITVVGSPNVSNIRTVLLGVRNPSRKPGTNDDGFPKCAEVWVNELRLTEFDERGGYAATARATATLADFARVTLAGSMSTVGFGSIEKSVTERNKEDSKQYSASANVELGKFFPEKMGVKIPMYVSVSEQVQDPQFNPLDPDIPLDAALDAQPPDQRDSLKRIVQDYTKQKSFNLTNVRKEKTDPGKSKVYDVENLSASYAFTERYHRDINTESHLTQTYRASLSYNFNTSPKNIRPLYNIDFLRKRKYLRLIRDFNFYYQPSRISVRTDVDRYYSAQQLRNTGNANLIIDPNFNKSFNWNRVYDIKYDLTRTLKFDFSANGNARVDEPEGPLDSRAKKDSLWDNFWNFGRPVTYNHTATLAWNTPLNKIPGLDFMSLNVRYSGSYNWNAASLAALSFGNNIQNNNNRQLNGQMNMTSLYNKIPYFRNLNKPQRPNRSRPRPGGGGEGRNQDTESPDQGSAEDFDMVKSLAKMVTSLKNVSVQYSETRGTMIPGFLPNDPNSPTGSIILGAEKFGTPGMAPDLGFLFGQQREDIGPYAARNGWLSMDTLLNQQISRTYSENLNLRATVEPFRNFRLELTGTKTYSENNSEFFDFSPNGDYIPQSPTQRGNFTMSFATWRTAFTPDGKDNESPVFEQFKNNRFVIAQRLASQHPSQVVIDPVTGYPEGFGPNSQDVLIPAFLAAYQDKNASNYNLSPFRDLPIPNWRVSFDGLNQIDFFKEKFRTISLSHAYRGSYNINSFQTNLDFVGGPQGFPTTTDASGNYIAENQINQISVSEQFSPLIRVDMTMHNSIQANIELKRDRSLSMSLTNGQLTESRGREYVIGGGYRIKDFTIIVNSGGRRKKYTSDLNLKADVTLRDNVIISRRLEQDENIVTSGNTNIKISTYADYVINQRFNVRVFYERNVSEPAISSSFKTSNTNIGVRIQFTLAG